MKLLQEEFPRPSWNLVFFFQCVCFLAVGCCYKPVGCLVSKGIPTRSVSIVGHERYVKNMFFALSNWAKDMICLDTSWTINMLNPKTGGGWFKRVSFSNQVIFRFQKRCEFSRGVSMGWRQVCPCNPLYSLKWSKRKEPIPYQSVSPSSHQRHCMF